MKALVAATLAVASLGLVASAAAAPAKKGAAAAAAASAASASAATVAPVEFSGALEPGRSYVAEMYFDANALKIWRPVKAVEVGSNTAWRIEWTNLPKFPALASAGSRAATQRIVFRVVSADVQSGSPKLPWTSIIRCEVLAVQPAVAPTKSSPRRR